MIALFEVFPPHRRGAAMGMFGFGVVLVPAIGPTIGGLLVEAFGWRSIFLMPLAVLPGGAWRWPRAFCPERTIRDPRSPFDWTGSALLGAALVALLNVPVIGHRMGWDSLALAASVVVTVGAGRRLHRVGISRARAAARAAAVRGARLSLGRARVLCLRSSDLFGTTYLIPVFVQDIAAYTPAAGRLPAAVAGRGAGNHHRAGGAAHGPRRSALDRRAGAGLLRIVERPARVLRRRAPASSCWRFG